MVSFGNSRTGGFGRQIVSYDPSVHAAAVEQILAMNEEERAVSNRKLALAERWRT